MKIYHLLLTGLFIFLISMHLASAAQIFFDGFESGGVGAWNLSSASGANNWTASTTNPFQGTVHAQSNPQSTSEPASILSKSIDLSGYQTINVSYYRRLIALDSADEFNASWFDGATWNSLENTGSNSADDASYVSKSFILPSSANNNPSFIIRFECTAGAVSEFCRVDNFNLTGSILDSPDNISPNVTLRSPTNATTLSTSISWFSALVEDNVNVTNATLYVWNSSSLVATNFTIVGNSSMLINRSITLPRGGTYFWNYQAFDNSSNNAWNNTNFTLTLTLPDTTPPSITINSPQNTTLNANSPRLNLTIVEPSIDSVWISLDGGATNVTYAHRNGTIDFGYLGLIFADDFDNYANGTSANPRWINLDSFANATVENKTYRLSNETPLDDALSYINSSYFSAFNYEGSARVMVPAGYNGSAYLTPRFNGVEWKYEIALDYQFSSINLNKVVANSWSQIMANWTGDFGAQYIVSRGEWHTLGFSAMGNNISAYVDQKLMLSATDNSLNNQTFTGFSLISLDDTNGHKAYFDDVELHRALAYGNHVLTIYANDSEGNENSTQVNFFINSTNPAPQISIAYPQNISYTSPPNAMNYTLTDQDPEFCWYTTNNGVTNTTIDCGSNITGLSPSEGSNSWRVYANDSVGNQNSTQVNFFVDSLQPQISFSQGTPSNGSYLPQGSIYINTSWTETNFASITFSLYNSSSPVNRTTFTNSRTDINFTSLADGIYFYNVSINDTSGSTNSTSTRTAIIDTISPGVSFTIPTESHGATIARNNILVNASSIDSNFANITLYLYNSSGLVNQTTYFTPNAFANFSFLIDGNYSFNATALDLAGNSNATETRTIKIDSSVPTITINAPQNITYNSAQIIFNVTINEDASFCNYSLNDLTNITMSSSNSRTFNASNSSIADGSYNVRYYCGDTAGNTNSTSVSFNLDTLAPTINILSPENTTYQNSTIFVNISSNGAIEIWFFNGTSNESYSSPVYRTFATGSNALTAYANDSAGNINSTAISFSVDLPSNNSLPIITLNSPADYSNLSSNSALLNATLSDADNNTLQTWIYGNNALLANYSSIPSPSEIIYNWTSLPNGQYNWTVVAFDGTGNSSESYHFTINQSSIAPQLIMSRPTLCATFGTNQSLPLNFTINSSSLDSCWYTTDNGANNYTLSNCANATFNISGNGDYIIRLYANETIQNKIGSASTSFKVQLNSPTILIESPTNNTAVNYSLISLNYFTEGNATNNINSCSLYGDFNSTFSLNQTSTSINNSNSNTFLVNLTQGRYNWNIACSNAFIETTLMCNYSLVSDIIPPNVTISEPSGTYNTNNSIPLVFSVIDDLSGVNGNSCIYNLTLNANGALISSSTIGNCANTLLSVAEDGTYQITLKANDNAGNSQISSSVFVVSSSPSSPSSGGSTGGQSSELPALRGFANISFPNLSPVYIKRGQASTIPLKVTNTGQRFLNNCHLSLRGDISSRITNDETVSLSSGETHNYNLAVSLGNTQPGQYPLLGTLICDEASQQFTLPIYVVPTDFDFRYQSHSRDVDTLNVNYLLEELIGSSQTISIEYELSNSFNITIAEGTETVSLAPKETLNKALLVRLPKDSFGEFTMRFDVSNSRERLHVEEPIFLSSQGITGLAISAENQRALSIFGMILIAIVAIFFIARYIYKKYQYMHYHKRPRKTSFLKWVIGIK